MNASIAHAGSWLLLQGAAHPDTVLMRQVGGVHGWFEAISTVASALLTLTFVVLVALLVGAAWEIRRISRETHAMITRFSGDATPLIQQAAVIITNVYTMTTTLRGQMEKAQATIDLAQEGLRKAVVETEERLSEFNALLHVVQEEAEGVFVATASTVRGVRAGASSLHNADDEDAEDDDSDLASEEMNDGYDDDYDDTGSDTPQARTTGPRIRARGR